MPIQIPIQRANPDSQDIPLPAYMTEHASGMDLFAACDKEIILNPGQRILMPTGILIAIPAGYEAQIRPRSGLALKQGITCLNTPGTIDADYRGEIKVILINLGQEPVLMRRGDRIAQMVVQKVERVIWQETELLPVTQRGAQGFGSTDPNRSK